MITAGDYIMKAARYLGLDKLADSLLCGQTADNDEGLPVFFGALNHVVCETAGYCPCVLRRKVNIGADGIFMLDNLEFKVSEVLSVRIGGKKQSFSVGCDSIELAQKPAGDIAAEIELAVYNQAQSLNDRIMLNASAGEAVVVYGICALYSAAQGLDDTVWDRKYRLALNALKKSTPEKRVKGRVWA